MHSTAHIKSTAVILILWWQHPGIHSGHHSICCCSQFHKCPTHTKRNGSNSYWRSLCFKYQLSHYQSQHLRQSKITFEEWKRLLTEIHRALNWTDMNSQLKLSYILPQEICMVSNAGLRQELLQSRSKEPNTCVTFCTAEGLSFNFM